MDHSSRAVGPYLYPFGFPVLLAPVYALFGMNFIVLKTYCTLFFLFSLVLVYYLFHSYFVRASQALLIVAAMAFHPEFIGLTDNVLSDFPFLFFSLLSLWLMQKPHSLFQQLALGLSISFSYFIRDIGVALLPTLLVYQLVALFHEKKGSSSNALYLIPYLIFIAAYLTISSLFPKGGENHYDMLWENFTPLGLWTRTAYYWNLLGVYFFVGPVLLIGVLLAVLAGMVATWRKNLHLIVYTLAVLSILVIWPAMQGARFVFPVIPFLLYFLIQGILVAYYTLYIPKQHLRVVQLGVVTLGALLVLAATAGAYGFIHKRSARTAQAIENNQSYTKELQGIYQYISTAVPHTAVIGFSKPRALRFYTDRNAVFLEQDYFNQSTAHYLLLRKEQFTKVPIGWETLLETVHYVVLVRQTKSRRSSCEGITTRAKS